MRRLWGSVGNGVMEGRVGRGKGRMKMDIEI